LRGFWDEWSDEKRVEAASKLCAVKATYFRYEMAVKQLEIDQAAKDDPLFDQHIATAIATRGHEE
jgi:hypothetical protein